jgi:hypothetical protein
MYAAWGELCRQLPVAACLLFNESTLRMVMKAIEAGFGLVMFTMRISRRRPAG